MFICVFLLFVKTLRWQPIFLFLHLREYRAVWLEALFDLSKNYEAPLLSIEDSEWFIFVLGPTVRNYKTAK